MRVIYTDKKYIGEIKELGGRLPSGILNKSCTNVGGTTIALTNEEPYIVAVPTKNLVANKVRSTPYICGIDGNIQDKGNVIATYLRAVQKTEIVPKFIVTYDSLPVLLKELGDLASGYSLLCDEYHSLFTSINFRTSAILGVYKSAAKCKRVTYMSASPIEEDFLPKELNELPKTTIKWRNQVQYKIDSVKSYHPVKTAINLVNQVLAGTYTFESKPVKELFIFINSVNSIRQIIKTCKLTEDNAKVVVADTEVNKIKLQGIPISVPSNIRAENKTIQFFTSTAFAGIDLESDAGLIVIVSDQTNKQTLLDVKTHIYQILGRLRNADNPFYRNAIHIYQPQSTVKRNTLTKEWEPIDIDALYKEELEAIDKAAYDNKAFLAMDNHLSESLKAARGVMYSRVLMYADSFIFYDKKSNTLEYLETKEKYARWVAKVVWHTYKNGFNLVSAYRDAGIESSSTSYDKQAKEIDILTISTVNFKFLCEKYIELRESSDHIGAERLAVQYPLIKEAYEQLGSATIRTLKHSKQKLSNALLMQSEEFKIFMDSELRNKFEIGKSYTAKDVKTKLQQIYSLVPIDAAVKATDLVKWVKDCKETRTKKGYQYTILELN